MLRDGTKPAIWIARSRKAERGFLDDVSLPWGQQVAVMFQILCTLVLDMPATAECLTNVLGISPDVLLTFEPWGHTYHTGLDCGCRSSDRTVAYVHAIVLDRPTSICALIVLLSHQAT